MFNQPEKISYNCKEQQPVIRGTITKSCSMQQSDDVRRITDLRRDVAEIYIPPSPLRSVI